MPLNGANKNDARLLDGLLNDSSGDETDLDLPEPSTLLQSGLNKPSTATKPVGSARQAQTTAQPVKPTESVKPTELVKPVETATPVESERSVELVEPAEAIEPAEKRQKIVLTYSSRKQAQRPRHLPATPAQQRSTKRSPAKQFTAIAENKADTSKADSNNEISMAGRRRKKSSNESNTSKVCHLIIQTTGLSQREQRNIWHGGSVSLLLFATSVAIYYDAELLENAAKTMKAAGAAKGQIFCTHLIAPVNENGRTPRTFKYLVGLACGALAVSPEWFTLSVAQQKLLPERPYAVVGDTSMAEYSLDGPRRVGELFAGYKVHLWGSRHKWDSMAHTCEQLRDLIIVAGAEVVELPEEQGIESADEAGANEGLVTSSRLRKRLTGRSEKEAAAELVGELPAKFRRLFDLPVSKATAVVLVELDDLKEKSCNTMQSIVAKTRGNSPCRTKSWFFDCISANTVL
ncbi:hypothetical protein BX070DRAFT_118565 [Coemansia spiralis]|nr:hypothetical protein BX070DRAFT_118565 [Coemansia spiralis]